MARRPRIPQALNSNEVEAPKPDPSYRDVTTAAVERSDDHTHKVELYVGRKHYSLFVTALDHEGARQQARLYNLFALQPTPRAITVESLT